MPGENIQKDNFYPRVKFETTMGDIVIELERRRAPITVNNFLSYVVRGEYDNTVFHRIVPNYIVQGGGYDADYKERKSKRTIYNESGNGLKNDAYTISMARKGDPHSAIRQFFFNAKDNDNLNPGRDWGYTVFGSVIEGTEVIDAMSMVETEYKAVVGFRDAPIENIMLKKASLLPEA
jgi:peptidyl-prolyl cis-trans isomerase A (cyclophilin A)